jgi:hypothetical protein
VAGIDRVQVAAIGRSNGGRSYGPIFTSP